jgi:allantoinase
MFTPLDEHGLSPTLMSTQCIERPAKLHGLRPHKGALRAGSDADLCVLERGDFVFDKTAIVDRPELRWSQLLLSGRKANRVNWLASVAL